MMFNFLIVVYFSIKFRVGLSMFGLLALNLYYFWKTHTNFINEADKQYLDQKILKSRFDSHRTQKFLPNLHFQKRVGERRNRENKCSGRFRDRETTREVHHPNQIR